MKRSDDFKQGTKELLRSELVIGVATPSVAAQRLDRHLIL